MHTITAVAIAPDAELVHQATVARDRAESLRAQSASLPGILAATYRRRASELELESFLLEATAGVPDSEMHLSAV